jgi:hypothetical protein
MADNSALVLSDSDASDDEFADYQRADGTQTSNTAASSFDRSQLAAPRDPNAPPMLAGRPVLPPPPALSGGEARALQQRSNALRKELARLEQGVGLNKQQRVAWEQRRRLPA